MNLYVAATRQDDGKTIVSLGLLWEIRKRIARSGYMKPVGQDYKIVNGMMIDKDAFLMNHIFKFKSALTDMSPVTVPSGFTEQYIRSGKKEKLEKRILQSYEKLRSMKDFVLIEGTGHAGVGSVFDLSNSDVAKLLGAKCIIVAEGGIGKTIDEIMLNCAKFRLDGVEVLGVIVNKIFPQKLEHVRELVTLGLARHGIRALGFIPFVNVLGYPTIRELLKHLKIELLCGEEQIDTFIECMLVGDLATKKFTSYLKGRTLLIIPGDYEDILLLLTMNKKRLGISENFSIAGIIATYGSIPSPKIVEIVSKLGIPLAVTSEDSFTVANKINRSTYKVTSKDTLKIETATQTVGTYVDIDLIMDLLDLKKPAG